MKRLYLVLFVSLFIFDSLVLHAMKAGGAGEVKVAVKADVKRAVQDDRIFKVKTVEDVKELLDPMTEEERVACVSAVHPERGTVFFHIFPETKINKKTLLKDFKMVHGEIAKAILDRIPSGRRLEILSIPYGVCRTFLPGEPCKGCRTVVHWSQNHYVIAACFDALSVAEREQFAMVKNCDGRTALHVTHSPQIAQILFDAVAPARRIGFINMLDGWGYTALILTAMQARNPSAYLDRDIPIKRTPIVKKYKVLLAQQGIDIAVDCIEDGENERYGGLARAQGYDLFDECFFCARQMRRQKNAERRARSDMVLSSLMAGLGISGVRNIVVGYDEDYADQPLFLFEHPAQPENGLELEQTPEEA